MSWRTQSPLGLPDGALQALPQGLRPTLKGEGGGGSVVGIATLCPL